MKKALLIFLGLMLPGWLLAMQRTIVKPGDMVTVNCSQESKLNKEYTISPDGYIVMQFVGAVPIAGLSEEAAGAKIESALVTQRILQRATVRVHVVSSRNEGIIFAGAIKNNGEMEAKQGLRLADVVAAADPNPEANMERVRIVTASGNEFMVNFKAYDGTNNVNNPQLRKGDLVLFDPVNGPQTPIPHKPTHPQQPPVQPQNPTPPQQTPDLNTPTMPTGSKPRSITVIGAVANPRVVSWHEGMGVIEAVEAAGGLLKNADTGSVKIERKIDGQQRVMTEDLKAAREGLAGDTLLRPNDVVNVPAQGHHGGPSKAIKIGALLLLGLVLLHP